MVAEEGEGGCEGVVEAGTTGQGEDFGWSAVRFVCGGVRSGPTAADAWKGEADEFGEVPEGESRIVGMKWGQA